MKKIFILILCTFSLHAMELTSGEISPLIDTDKLIEHLQALIIARQQEIADREAECNLVNGILWQKQTTDKQKFEAAQAYNTYNSNHQKIEAEKEARLTELRREYEYNKAQLEKDYRAKAAPFKAQENQALQNLNAINQQEAATTRFALNFLSNIHQQARPAQAGVPVQSIAAVGPRSNVSGSHQS